MGAENEPPCVVVETLDRDYGGYRWRVALEDDPPQIEVPPDMVVIPPSPHRTMDVVVIVSADDFGGLDRKAYCQVWTADSYVTGYWVLPTARDELPLPLRNSVEEGDRGYLLRLNPDYLPYTRISFCGRLPRHGCECGTVEYSLSLGDVVKLR